MSVDLLLAPPQPDPDPAPPTAAPRRRRRWVAAATALVLVAGGFGLWGPWRPSGAAGGGNGADSAATWRRPVVAAEDLPQQSGVKIVRVAASGAGGLLDLRYQVVDPDLAAAIHDAKTPPAIVDERSGIVFSHLFMGHAHDGPVKAAVTYYLVFENSGSWVHPGDKVTVLLGNAQVEHVTVS